MAHCQLAISAAVRNFSKALSRKPQATSHKLQAASLTKKLYNVMQSYNIKEK
tara:strand:- start:221 stop:376 length:156 start_codon:yes stop_codon:yes gene_type:complete